MGAENGHAEVAKFLIKAGYAVDKAENNGVTPLFMSAVKEHDKVGETLIKAVCTVA